jgi:hypothetical protein
MTARPAEVVASYYVNVVYNNLYRYAYEHGGEKGGISKTYQGAVQNYLAGIQGDENCYNIMAGELARYYAENRNTPSLSYAEFASQIISLAIPKGLERECSDAELDEFVAIILRKTLAAVAARAIQRTDRIVQNRKETHAVEIQGLTSEGVGVFTTACSEIQSLITKKAHGITANSNALPAERVREKMKELIASHNETKEALAAAKERIKHLSRREQQILRINEKLRERVDQLSGSAAPRPPATVPQPVTGPHRPLAQNPPSPGLTIAPQRPSAIALPQRTPIALPQRTPAIALPQRTPAVALPQRRPITLPQRSPVARSAQPAPSAPPADHTVEAAGGADAPIFSIDFDDEGPSSDTNADGGEP